MIIISKRKKFIRSNKRQWICIKGNVIIYIKNPKCIIIKKKRLQKCLHKKKKLTSKMKKWKKAKKSTPPIRRTPRLQIKPIVRRFFYIPKSDLSLTKQLQIPSGNFVDDHGESIDHFPQHSEDSYWNLYINGVLQEGKLYAVDAKGLTITMTGQKIPAETPIILEFVQIAASES